MKVKTKSMNKNKLMTILIALFFSLSVVVFAGTISYAWFVSQHSAEGKVTIADVNLEGINIPLLTSETVVPGMELIKPNLVVKYSGVLAYVRVKINIEFFEQPADDKTEVGKKINVDGVTIDPEYYSVNNGDTVNIIKNKAAYNLPGTVGNEVKGKIVRVSADISAIQQANLPIDIKTPQAAFEWYAPVLNFNSMKIPETITLPNESAPVAIKKELGTGENSGKFRIVKEASAKSSKTVSSNKKVTPTGSQEFAFFSNIAITDSNAQSVDLTNFKRYDLGIWYDLPQTKIDINTIYLTPNYTSGVMSNKSIQIAIIKNGTSTISANAFKDCSNLKVAIIPASVASIGNSAFYYCRNLTSITIPASVESIGDNAFYECSSLTSITIPASVTSIGWRVFNQCSSLTSITIPNGVTSIGTEAFKGCGSLTSITMPTSVTSIGDFAFSSCSGLTSITIPASVTSIGDGVFSVCGSLTSINVDINNKNFTSVDGVLYNKNNTKLKLKKYPEGKVEVKFIMPASVTSIWKDAFKNCSSLTSITIPNSVTNIGKFAFSGCSKLTSITIDSATIAGLASTNSNLYDAATTVYVKSGLTVGTAITDLFKNSTTENGYVKYTK